MGYLLVVLGTFFGNIFAGVSMHVVMSLTGIVFLGLPTSMKIGSYAMAIAGKAGIAPELSFLIGVLASLVTALLFSWLFIRVSQDSFVVLGLASVLATEAMARSWDKVTNGALGISGIQRPVWMNDLMPLVLFAGIAAVLILLVELILLRTWVGRALRAYREDSVALESMGVPTQKVAQGTIIFSCLLVAVGSAFYLWRIQFLDPNTFSIPLLVELLTLAILSLKPKVRYVIISAVLITFLPEALRFAQIPSSILGYARVLLYSFVLMILIRKFSSTYIIPRRSVRC